MCRRAQATGRALAWLALTAIPVAAQNSTSEPPVEALERRMHLLLERIESLEPRAAAEGRDREASMRSSLEAPVERSVQGLRIRALPRDIDVASDLFVAAWEERFAPRFGAPPAALAEAPLAYYDHRGEWNPRFGEDGNPEHYVQAGNDTGDPVAQAVTAISGALLSNGPIRHRLWLNWEGFDPALDTRTVRRQLAAAPSVATTRCILGSIDACTAALGLRPKGWSQADVVAAWYSPEQRQWVGDQPLLRHSQGVRMRADDGSLQDVIPAGTRIRHDLAPTTVATRSSLLLHALHLGGPDVLERFMALDPAVSIEAALESVAGQPLAEIVASWRDQLLADQAPGDRHLPTRSTLGWVGLVALFAMTSTRWRLS